MIRYALACERGHGFEAWFRGSGDYDDQAARGLVACPACGSARVGKAIMAPALARGAGKGREPAPAEPAPAGPASPPAAPPSREPPSGSPSGPPAPAVLLGEKERELRAAVRALRERVHASSEDVGRRFAAEALAIHRGEAPERTIRGAASPAEARALIEEGVPFSPLPGLPEDGH